MVEVINCLAQTDKKTERVKIIVKAAEQFLGIRGLVWEVEECLVHSHNHGVCIFMVIVILQLNARSLIGNGQ